MSRTTKSDSWLDASELKLQAALKSLHVQDIAWNYIRSLIEACRLAIASVQRSKNARYAVIHIRGPLEKKIAVADAAERVIEMAEEQGWEEASIQWPVNDYNYREHGLIGLVFCVGGLERQDINMLDRITKVINGSDVTVEVICFGTARTIIKECLEDWLTRFTVNWDARDIDRPARPLKSPIDPGADGDLTSGQSAPGQLPAERRKVANEDKQRVRTLLTLEGERDAIGKTIAATEDFAGPRAVTVVVIEQVAIDRSGTLNVKPTAQEAMTRQPLTKDELVKRSRVDADEPLVVTLAYMSKKDRQAFLDLYYPNRTRWDDVRSDKPTPAEFRAWVDQNFGDRGMLGLVVGDLQHLDNAAYIKVMHWRRAAGTEEEKSQLMNRLGLRERKEELSETLVRFAPTGAEVFKSLRSGDPSQASKIGRRSSRARRHVVRFGKGVTKVSKPS